MIRLPPNLVIPKPFGTTHKCWPQPVSILYWPCVCLVALVVAAGSHYEIKWYEIVSASLFILFVGMSLLRQAFIEPANKSVREFLLLFNKFALQERVFPFKEFTEIFCDLNDVEDTEYWVKLRHKSGHVIFVKNCGATSRRAEELAWQISCETGITLNEQYISERFKQRRSIFSATIKRIRKKFRK